MKDLYRAFIGVTVVGLLLFNSCVPEDLIVEDLAIKLTNGSWAFQNVETGDDFLNDGFKIEFDNNVLDFSSDGTCTDLKLGVNGNGTWSLNGNQDNLTLNVTYEDDDTRNESWEIISITSSELRYKFQRGPNTLEMTYTH